MPKDFTKKSFSKLLRGYSPEEVDEYIAYINEEYRKLERKNSENERKLSLAMAKIDALNSSAAERENERETAENAKITAQKSAENILSEAAVKAEAILAAAKNEADGVYKAASDMYDEVCSFRDSLFSLYNDHIVAIEGMTNSAELYINKVDGAYSAAGGETVPHDEPDEPDESDEPDEPDDLDGSDDYEDSDEFGGSYDGDNSDETADTTESDTAEDSFDDFDDSEDVLSFEDDEDFVDDSDLRIDWRKREAVETDENASETRILDLNLLAEEDDEDEPLTDDSQSPDDSGDFEDPDDFVDGFREMDSLFTLADSSQELPLEDEFDVVFADADRAKNAEKARRTQNNAQNKPTGKTSGNKFGKR